MRDFPSTFDELTRRNMLAQAAWSLWGLSYLSTSALAKEGTKEPPKDSASKSSGSKSTPKGGKAQNVIYLYMNGGMSHLDTFDLKPGSKVQGETKPIATKVSGMQISESLPELAKQADRLAIIRSLSTETGAHEPGRYLMLTSYKEIATTRHPFMGSWAQKLLGKRGKSLPDSVVVGGSTQHPGAGFLEPSFSPLPIDNPDDGLQNTKAPSYLSDKSFEKRLHLIDKFDDAFRKRYHQKPVQAYNDFYQQAVKLLTSDELKAFDLKGEDDKKRDAYGRNRFGQGVLLARRLIENGIRFVQVDCGGWDNHNEIFQTLPPRAGQVDQAFGALLTDLHDRGLLDKTLIVLATEFGRTPNINTNSGRDHHPGVFSCVLAGGGIKGGQFHGTSDKDGHSPKDDPVKVADFNATIASAMGLPLDEQVFSKAGRPFKVANGGKPIGKLLS